jgi:hypothetical protein
MTGPGTRESQNNQLSQIAAKQHVTNAQCKNSNKLIKMPAAGRRILRFFIKFAYFRSAGVAGKGGDHAQHPGK